MLIFLNCSSSVESSLNKSVIDKSHIIHLDSYDLTFQVPDGWNQIKDNYRRIFEVWLVNENRNSAIGIIPINLSKSEIFGNSEDKLKLIEKVILSKKKSNTDVEIISTDRINIDKQVSQTRMMVNGNFQNSIIFGEKENYFECLAYFLDGYEPTNTEIEKLISDQILFVRECK